MSKIYQRVSSFMQFLVPGFVVSRVPNCVAPTEHLGSAFLGSAAWTKHGSVFNLGQQFMEEQTKMTKSLVKVRLQTMDQQFLGG